MNRIVLSFLLLTFVFACKNTQENDKTIVQDVAGDESTLQEPEIEDDWLYLFDGTSLDGWRAYGEAELPPGWKIQDHELTYDTQLGLEQDYTGGRDIIYAAEEFENFELSLEWKLPQGGNSGVFYHVREGYGNIYEVAPEYQLIDDDNYAAIHDLTAYNKSVGHTENLSELKPLNKTGADYGMYGPDVDMKELHPVGEWNTSKIVFTPEKVEHWLNGKKLLSFTPWSDDWMHKKNSGKWKDMSDYGKYKSGYIGLQDHQSPIWFRNIKIRKL